MPPRKSCNQILMLLNIAPISIERNAMQVQPVSPSANTPAKHIPRNRELIAEVIFNWGTHFLLPIPNSLYVTMQFPFSSSMELVEALLHRAALKMVGSKNEIYHLRHLHIERMVSPCLFTFRGTCREVSNVNIN